MKTSAKLTLLIAIAITFISCIKEKKYWFMLTDTYRNDYHLPRQSDIAWPEGSMLTYLGGNVDLDVLPGAVESPVIISVGEFLVSESGDYALKMISIEPGLSFQGPVNVRMQYNGCLANGSEIVDGCLLEIRRWDNKETFMDGAEGQTLCCTRDAKTCSINFCIQETGVFAVKMRHE